MKLTICGSIAVYAKLEGLKEKLERNGHEVLLPLLKDEVAEFAGDKKLNFGQYIEEHGGVGAFALGDRIWDMKAAAIRNHYDKIDWCDAVVVANYEKRSIPGYIGGNTLMEMAVAFYLKKPIYVLNAVSLKLSYVTEIFGMKPIMLDGDLGKISV